MFKKLKHWFYSRFVTIMEGIGYAISLTILSWAVYSLFVTVEVLVPSLGLLRPPEHVIFSHETTVLVAYDVGPGEEVAEGDVVCRVATDPAYQRRLLALHKVEDAIALLDEEPVAAVDTLLRPAEQALSSVTDEVVTTSLQAPAAGYVFQEIDLRICEALDADTPLARIYDLHSLTLVAVLDEETIKPVAVGQLARVRDMSFPVIVEGEVVSVDTETSTATLRFENIPDAAHEFFYDLLFGEEPGQAFPAVAVEVVVDYQTLFKQTFARQ